MENDVLKALSKRLWVNDCQIPEDEARELIKAVLREHWHTIKAIHEGHSEEELAYVKLDPLVIAVSILGVMQPASSSCEDIAACFLEKYYPEIQVK